MDKPTVIITGANNGIGLHMALALTDRGYNVAALDLSGENLALQPPGGPAFYPCNVANDMEVRQTVDEVHRRWGRIDILVNNACQAVFAPFLERSLEDLRTELEVNFLGYVRMIQAVLPHMREQRRGLIHNVSSGVGLTGFRSLSGYTAAKGAIEALSRTLDLELARDGIRVTVMHPPLTNTRSAAPLGIPGRAMADPEVIGRRLASRIEQTKPVIVPDLSTAIYVWVARRFPAQVGRLMSNLADRGAGRST